MILVASYLSDSYMSHFSAIFFEKKQKQRTPPAIFFHISGSELTK